MTSVTASACLSPARRVAIVGGGPAGSFAALNFLRFARQLGIPVSVTIYQRKDFERRGPAGCNKCAGILSVHAVAGISKLGLEIPEKLVLARLEGYTVHIAGHAVEIDRPNPDRTILSVYRGGGPLRGTLRPDVSFDAWLLAEAVAAGATLVNADVRKLTNGSPHIDVETDAGGKALISSCWRRASMSALRRWKDSAIALPRPRSWPRTSC